MVVSRVHLNPALEADLEDDFAPLKTALIDLHQGDPITETRFGDMSICVDSALVYFAFYHTLELGDLVVVMKSNSIVSCLCAMRRIMETAQVGDVYSYCGIHSALVKQSMEEAVQTWDGGSTEIFHMDAATAMKKRLPNANMRFSIRSARRAKCFWDTLDHPIFFVAGTADTIMNLDDHTLWDLIQCVFDLIFDQYLVDPADPNAGSFDMYDAFEDIITRIGFQYEDIYCNALAIGKSALPETLVDIQCNLRTGINCLKEQKTRWIPTLIAQTNLLIAMMGNCVTDDLSMLIWPSVCALMERLQYLLKINQSISPSQEKDIGLFLNSCLLLKKTESQRQRRIPKRMRSRCGFPISRNTSALCRIDLKTARMFLTRRTEISLSCLPRSIIHSAPICRTVQILFIEIWRPLVLPNIKKS